MSLSETCSVSLPKASSAVPDHNRSTSRKRQAKLRSTMAQDVAPRSTVLDTRSSRPAAQGTDRSGGLRIVRAHSTSNYRLIYLLANICCELTVLHFMARIKPNRAQFRDASVHIKVGATVWVFRKFLRNFPVAISETG
jgi:hypothetical protein